VSAGEDHIRELEQVSFALFHARLRGFVGRWFINAIADHKERI
jgi:hypothetical protein